METTETELSIVLVNYKTPQLLLDCIASIITETPEVTHEIIVVDNQSEDDSEQRVKTAFPQVVWINAGYNSGFARANNMGIRVAKGTYCLVLNSDTIVKERALEKALTFYKQQETQYKLGFVGCKIVHFDGYTQFNSNTHLNLWGKMVRSNAFYKLIERVISSGAHQQRQEAEQKRRAAEHTQMHETHWLGGAFLLFRTAVCQTTDTLLDEDFFMYCEDQEWCLRLGRLGYRHLFYPDAYILHAEGGSFVVKEGKYKQIILSEWLLVMKLYGKAAYLQFVFIAAFNLFCDQLLYVLAKMRGKLSGKDHEEQVIRTWKWEMLKQHCGTILFCYKRATSSANKFLKYGG